MKFIIGLGNPTPRYKNTRHNIGFQILARLAKIKSAPFRNNKKLLSKTAPWGKKATLVLPQTFMNSSGEAVSALQKYFRLGNSSFLIVHDEIDLPLGRIKFSNNSGAAGHRGVVSIISAAGKNIARLRIGIDNRADKKQPTENYVLENFTREENKILEEKLIPDAVKMIETWMETS